MHGKVCKTLCTPLREANASILMASPSFFVKSKLVFLRSNRVPDREASAPAGDTGIQNDGLYTIFITGLLPPLGGIDGAGSR